MAVANNRGGRPARGAELGPVEDMVAKELAAMHKEVTGRGPRNVLVRILGDVIGFRFVDVLTPIEQSLLQVEGGAAQVQELRAQLALLCRGHLEEKLQEYLGVEVVDMVVGFDIKSGRLYGAVSLDRDVQRAITERITTAGVGLTD